MICVALAMLLAILPGMVALADDPAEVVADPEVATELAPTEEVAAQDDVVVEGVATDDGATVEEAVAGEAAVDEEAAPVDDEPALAEEASAEDAPALEEQGGYLYIHAQVHIQGYGWINEDDYVDGKPYAPVILDGSGPYILGTTGQGRRIEAIQLCVDNGTGYSGSLEYRVHVQNKGWTPWVDNSKDGQGNGYAGTVGQGLRIEAIEMRFTGELAENYDITYRAHVQNIGWMGWTSNGGTAGTSGLSRRVEAIQVYVNRSDQGSLPKDSAVPYAYIGKPSVEYRAHVQGIGWQSWVRDGALAGTSGQSRRIEALNIRLTNVPDVWGPESMEHKIEYCAHVQGIGWQGWQWDGRLAGTSGQSRRVEAIQIRLTKNYARVFDVYYRVHVQGIGWMGWAKNGESAGTSGMSRRIEGIQIRLVPRWQSAPGSTADHFRSK